MKPMISKTALIPEGQTLEDWAEEQRSDLWADEGWREKHPLILFLWSITRLGLPTRMTVNLMHLNKFTHKYAEVWYHKNMIPKEGIETQE